MDSAGDPSGSRTAAGRAQKMRQRYDEVQELEKRKRELMKSLEKY
jgi:HAMP domain-containing protein